MKSEDELDIWPPIRLVFMGVMFIAGLIFLPNAWWLIVVKIFLAIFLFGTITGAFNSLWADYETMGAFVIMQLICFGLIMLFPSIDLVVILSVAVIMIGWFTMWRRINGKVRVRDRE